MAGIYKQGVRKGRNTAVSLHLMGSALILSAAIAGCGGGGGGGSAAPAGGSSTYTIGGSLSGLASGAQIVLLDNATNTLPVTANGNFQFSTAVASGGSYAVTIQTQPAGQYCTVAAGSGTNVTANVSSVSVTCANSSTAGYTWKTPPVSQSVGTILSPSIASLGSGTLAGAYVLTQLGVAHQVYAMVGSFATNTWGTPVAISAPTGTPTGNVLALPNGTTGNAIVAWTTQVTGAATYGVWASTYTASTATWGAAAQIGTATAPQIQGGSSQSGFTVIGWQQASTAVAGSTALGLWEANPAGASVATTELETGAVSIATLAIGANSTGAVSVAWAGSTQVELAISGTGLWTSPAQLGASSAVATFGDISLAVDATAGDAVAWSGSDSTVHAAFYSPGGTLQASNTLAIAGAVNSLPAIASLGSGNYLMIFAAQVGGGGNFGYSAKYSSAAGWGATVALGQISWGASHLMVDTGGDAVVVNHITVGNEAAYSMPVGATAWSGGNVEYNVPLSASTMEAATGRVATLWSNAGGAGAAGFSSDFFD